MSVPEEAIEAAQTGASAQGFKLSRKVATVAIEAAYPLIERAVRNATVNECIAEICVDDGEIDLIDRLRALLREGEL